jgi:hypothetical protein
MTFVDEAELSTSLLTVSLKPSTDAGPGGSVGAVKEATAAFAFVKDTDGPAVCVQAKVSDRAGTFGSVPAPLNVTAVAGMTLCHDPALAVGRLGKPTVTLVVDVALKTPLLTVSVKPSTTRARSFGAMNVATAASAFVKETNGPDVCVQLKVSGCVGLFGSVPVPVNVTGRSDAVVCDGPALAVGGMTSGVFVHGSKTG